MKKQYLHLSAYSCDKCAGPVIAGSIGVRENEISKETDLRQVGAVCLSCGQKQTRRARPAPFHPCNGSQSKRSRRVLAPQNYYPSQKRIE